MKTKYKQLIYSLSIIGLVLLSACEKDEEVKDIIKPNCSIVKPTDDALFFRGSSIIFEGYFTDDIELGSCELFLTTLKATKGWDDPWTPLVDRIELSGTKADISAYQVFKDIIPQDIMSGDYILNIKVSDKAGNFSMYTVNIYID